jgi:hypothetical protein
MLMTVNAGPPIDDLYGSAVHSEPMPKRCKSAGRR